MKNQYVGDINDYRKYGLLRILTQNPIVPTMVCWMLTPDDNGPDGDNICYLLSPNKWSKYDPDLFGLLRDTIIKRDERHISPIEKAGILPACYFFSKILANNEKHEREEYFTEFDHRLRETGNSEPTMIFFDPDNGIAPPKAQPHRNKYLYWDEIEKYFNEKNSLLIYQHFPMVNHKQFISDTANKLKNKTGARKIFSFETSHVVFFLIPYNGHIKKFDFERKIREIQIKWENQIIAGIH